MKHYPFKAALLFAIFAISARLASAQGINNSYSVDQTDLRTALELQGIHVFKFPLHFGQPGRVRFVFETYEGGKLQNEFDPIGRIMARVPDPSQLMPAVGAEKMDTVRLYIRERSDSSFDIRTAVGSMSQTIPMSRTAGQFGAISSRAFDIKPQTASKGKNPLLVLYSQASDAAVTPCPANATPLEIGKTYAWAMVVYLLTE